MTQHHRLTDYSTWRDGSAGAKTEIFRMAKTSGAMVVTLLSKLLKKQAPVLDEGDFNGYLNFEKRKKGKYICVFPK